MLNLGNVDICDAPARRSDYLHVLTSGRPYLWIGRAKEQNAIRSRGGGEMRDTAVVADENCALEQRGKMRQRQIFREPEPRGIFPNRLELRDCGFI